MVVTKRRTTGPQQQGMIRNTSAQLKYRPFVETGRSASKGTKPLPNPITIPEIFTKVMIHCCKRVLYGDPKIRLMIYAILLFFISLVADYMPFPKTYFSSSSNFLNQFFVKFSWAWTLSFVAIFLLLTSSVYCCADRKQIGRHLIRLLIATLIWFIWTTLFTTVEELTGKCIYVSPGSLTETVYSKGRRPCISNGGKWTSFDISGHSFLLIWCVLFIIEETKPIIGWDIIEDHIRNEDHKRSDLTTENSSPETPLSSLSNEEFVTVKKLYKRFGVAAKIVVVFLTFLTLVWDFMLIMTACYFHIMIEKVIGGLIAILMWCVTYGTFYKLNITLSPGLPGSGKFKYSNLQHGCPTKSTTINSSTTKSKSKNSEELPLFMGMPLYALGKKQKEATNDGVRSPLVPSK